MFTLPPLSSPKLDVIEILLGARPAERDGGAVVPGVGVEGGGALHVLPLVAHRYRDLLRLPERAHHRACFVDGAHGEPSQSEGAVRLAADRHCNKSVPGALGKRKRQNERIGGRKKERKEGKKERKKKESKKGRRKYKTQKEKKKKKTGKERKKKKKKKDREKERKTETGAERKKDRKKETGTKRKK